MIEIIALFISFGALFISVFTLYLNYLKPPKIEIEHISNIVHRDAKEERRYKDYIAVLNNGAKIGLMKRIMPRSKNNQIRVLRENVLVTNEENDWEIFEPDPHAVIPIKSKTSYVIECETVCYSESFISPLNYAIELSFDKGIKEKNLINRSPDRITIRRV